MRGLGLTLTFTFIQGVLHPFNITPIDALHIFYTLFYNLYFCLLGLCIHRSIQPLPSPIYFPVRKALYSWYKLFIADILATRVRTTLHRPFRNLASESRRCYVAFWLPEQVHKWRQFYQRLFVFSVSTGYFHRFARLVLSSAMHSVLPHVDSKFPLLL